MELVRLKRVAVPREVIKLGADYALFIGEVGNLQEASPQVDLSRELYLRRAAWHPVSRESPLGPLSPRYWSHVAPLILQRL